MRPHRLYLKTVYITSDLDLLDETRLNQIPYRRQLDELSPFSEFVTRYPIKQARQYCVLAFEPNSEATALPLGIADEQGLAQLELISRFFRRPIEPFRTDKELLLKAINHAYQNRSSQTATAIKTLDTGDVLKITKSERQDLLDQQGNPPVIRLVNSILFDAVQERASDIHIQPYESKLQVRFRIDGVLFDQFEIPKASQEEVLSRLKIIGKMNIAEKRLPQDGRATAEIGDRKIDLRIASLPTNFGERIVIRLLDKSARLYTLDQLGMEKDDLEDFLRLIRLEHGLILVTGPTGSGKSTTLYASLQEININSANVVTLEDPIEYQLEGISQTQISEKRGMTFASGLRSILRQDPDIIMIGEIRDHETAELGIQSALTGHMVFSTLHTNDAPSAVTRLLELEIEPFLVASSVVGVLSQRLVRKICSQCRVPLTPEQIERKADKKALGILPKLAYIGSGCSHCRQTGYAGRVGVFELMVVTESIKQLIQSRASAFEIRNAARADGMMMLCEDGIRKIESGMTTIEEVTRISVQLEN